MRTIAGTITEIKTYSAGRFSEHVNYTSGNSSKCALITLDTGITADMVLEDGASPKVGDTISTEVDAQGNFGFLYPDEIGVQGTDA